MASLIRDRAHPILAQDRSVWLFFLIFFIKTHIPGVWNLLLGLKNADFLEAE
jgi:hypothetical protein